MEFEVAFLLLVAGVAFLLLVAGGGEALGSGSYSKREFNSSNRGSLKKKQRTDTEYCGGGDKEAKKKNGDGDDGNGDGDDGDGDGDGDARGIPILLSADFGHGWEESSRIILDDAVVGYYSFARKLQRHYIGFEELIWGEIPHAMWPWPGYIFTYIANGGEEIIPISEEWSSFKTKLNRILVRDWHDENDDFVDVTFERDGCVIASGAIYKRFILTESSFARCIHFLWCGFLGKEPAHLRPPSLMVSDPPRVVWRIQFLDWEDFFMDYSFADAGDESESESSNVATDVIKGKGIVMHDKGKGTVMQGKGKEKVMQEKGKGIVIQDKDKKGEELSDPELDQRKGTVMLGKLMQDKGKGIVIEEKDKKGEEESASELDLSVDDKPKAKANGADREFDILNFLQTVRILHVFGD